MQVNAHVAGVLLNAVDLTSPDYYYYYEYQGKYTEYYREGAEGESEPGKKAASSGISKRAAFVQFLELDWAFGR